MRCCVTNGAERFAGRDTKYGTDRTSVHWRFFHPFPDGLVHSSFEQVTLSVQNGDILYVGRVVSLREMAKKRTILGFQTTVACDTTLKDKRSYLSVIYEMWFIGETKQALKAIAKLRQHRQPNWMNMGNKITGGKNLFRLLLGGSLIGRWAMHIVNYIGLFLAIHIYLQALSHIFRHYCDALVHYCHIPGNSIYYELVRSSYNLKKRWQMGNKWILILTLCSK